LGFFFCRATREDSILFAGSSDRETPFEAIPGDRDCEKNSQIGRLLKIEIKSLDKNHTHFYFQFIS
jgi:hypothetical protein